MSKYLSDYIFLSLSFSLTLSLSIFLYICIYYCIPLSFPVALPTSVSPLFALPMTILSTYYWLTSDCCRHNSIFSMSTGYTEKQKKREQISKQHGRIADCDGACAFSFLIKSKFAWATTTITDPHLTVLIRPSRRCMWTLRCLRMRALRGRATATATATKPKVQLAFSSGRVGGNCQLAGSFMTPGMQLRP